MWKQFRAHSWEARLALLFVAFAGAYAIADAVLAPAPAPSEPGFIDTVLGSRAVVAAVRLAVICAAIFVMASAVALISRRQWLTRIGSVQVSEPVSEMRASKQQLNELSANIVEPIETQEERND